MSKRTVLGQDLKVGDKVLLPMPEIELIEEVDAKDLGIRRSPKSKYFRGKDKATKTEHIVVFSANEKVKRTYRPSNWELFKRWLERNHATYQHASTLKRIK
jgi:hypothetical protein